MKRTTIINTIATLGIGIVVPFSSMATSFAATPTDTYTAVDKAVAYLVGQQQSDGSIAGYGGESDWTAIALAALGTTNTQLNNFIANEPAPTTVSGIERKILALAATGQATSGYTALLATHYQDNQIGDAAYLNDDWFGIMAIIASKDTADYHIAADAVQYILAHQDASGGFSYCADTTQQYCGINSNDTAAAIVALASAQTAGIVEFDSNTAITNAAEYLASTQQLDGGYGYDSYSSSDGSSTAWVTIALNTVDDSTQAEGAKAWMLANQNSDGGFGYVAYDTAYSDTYTTPNTILALLSTNWLLNPAPISRPIVETPAETPVATTPSSTVAATTTSSSVTTPTVTTAAAVDTTEPVASTETETSADTTTEETPQVKATSTNKAGTEKVTTNNTARTIGISLIAFATIGFVAYGLILRRRRLE